MSGIAPRRLPTPPAEWELRADVVVVGSGAAGMATALAATRCGRAAAAAPGRRAARTRSPAVRTMIIVRAMKISPSVIAASETWLAVHQDTIELVNQ